MVTTIARALALLCLVSALPARAAPIDDAKKAFSEGKAAFERGDYETALSAYQRANMILPAPNLYYNIGATYERLGRYQEAALAFDKYFELAGQPTTDEERTFQEKLRERTDADRKRPNLPPRVQAPATPQPAPPQAAMPPQPGSPYYVQPYYMTQQQQQPKDVRIKEARGRRTRAIVLMGIGVPMSVAGIILAAWAAAPNVQLDFAPEVGYIFLGVTLGVVGVTLWAPGAASFVRSSNDLKNLNKPDPPPLAPPPAMRAAPPTARGF
ncbi:MAG: hypothetical protein JWN44_6674 [Myxococcales bacterium]|nr:hypothetical protein [Myxococcales bacterium]